MCSIQTRLKDSIYTAQSFALGGGESQLCEWEDQRALDPLTPGADKAFEGFAVGGSTAVTGGQGPTSSQASDPAFRAGYLTGSLVVALAGVDVAAQWQDVSGGDPWAASACAAGYTPWGRVGRGARALDDAADVARAADEVAPAVRGGAGPVRAGQAGEAYVRARYDIGPKTRFEINDRYRIADGVTRDSITEIKNVRYQGLTRQIRDYLDYKGDKTFYLYIRRDTRLSGRLKEKIRDGSR